MDGNATMTWDAFFAWCEANNRKRNDGSALVEFVRGKRP